VAGGSFFARRPFMVKLRKPNDRNHFVPGRVGDHEPISRQGEELLMEFTSAFETSD
jgi:hypothetical protein